MLPEEDNTVLILFFDSHGVIHCYFLDNGTVKSDIYIDSLRAMRESLRRKCPTLWRDQNFVLLQDNASPHTSDDTVEYMESVNLSVWSHLPNSPDMSPCDYWAFPVLKSHIRRHRFETLEDVKVAVKRTLQDIPLADFQNCFDNLLVWYKKCVAASGNYFEGQGRRGLPRDNGGQ